MVTQETLSRAFRYTDDPYTAIQENFITFFRDTIDSIRRDAPSTIFSDTDDPTTIYYIV